MSGKHIKADRTIRGPQDLEWADAGAVVHVADDRIARELLLQPYFTEVDPAAHGRHEAPVTEPAPEAPAADDEGDDEAKKTTRTRKTAVTE